MTSIPLVIYKSDIENDTPRLDILNKLIGTP